MAKGRQTKTLARISVTASIVELPAGSGRKFLNWSVTRPRLAKNFPGVE